MADIPQDVWVSSRVNPQWRPAIELAQNRSCSSAASPDGIVLSDGKMIGTIEIKCPYTCRDMSVRNGCKNVKSFFCELVDDRIRLKINHQYYYQVQGAMAVAGVEWCDFIVWTNVDMHKERISFNLSFWNSCYSKLQTIYSSYILPEIIYPRLPSNLDIIAYSFPIFNNVYCSEP